MSFLAPWALLWLGAIPLFLWLWRLASTHRVIHIPSLAPFEHLLRRPARRRTRLVVNILFWLQLAALMGLALALAQPVLLRPRATTILAILDTSASMGARERGRRAFERAKQELVRRIERKAPTARVFLMVTSPVAPVLPEPTADAATLTTAIHALSVSHLGGNLATTVRLGRSLLGQEPDEILVVTDEPPPPDRVPDTVRWVRVGEPLPNVAIVGLDAQGSLCTPMDARVIATVHNFSDEAAVVDLTAAQRGHELSRASAQLAPRARVSVPLPLPPETDGELDITLQGPRDGPPTGVRWGGGLDVDNQAWLQVRRSATLPVVIQAEDPALVQTVSHWLSACPTVQWTATPPSGNDPFLLVTNQEGAISMSPAPAALMVFHLPAAARQQAGAPSRPTPILAHWLVSADHPIGAYLAPLEVVAARLDPSATIEGAGIPVVSGLVSGRKVPIVVAEERDGRRLVRFFLDPAGSQESTPVVLAFFNSLRWLRGSSQPATAGEPLTLSGFASGTVKVRRPDGSSELVAAEGGLLRYDATTVAGRYHFSQRSTELVVGVTFINPLESNLIDRVSTWRTLRLPAGQAGEPLVRLDTSRRVTHPLASLLMWLLLVILLVEWRLYSARRARAA